jgi:hypothetical protein
MHFIFNHAHTHTHNYSFFSDANVCPENGRKVENDDELKKKLLRCQSSLQLKRKELQETLYHANELIKTLKNALKNDEKETELSKDETAVDSEQSAKYDDGEFKEDNKKNGRGVYIYADGAKYIGEYKDGKLNGRAVYISASGDKYDGEFKDTKKNGRGVMKWANGDKYDGEWKDDKRNGRGIMAFADGAKYDGEWKDDKKNGRGVYIHADGVKYDGEFIEDKRSEWRMVRVQRPQ